VVAVSGTSQVLRRLIAALFLAVSTAVAATLPVATFTACLAAAYQHSLGHLLVAGAATLFFALLARLYIVQAQRTWRSLRRRRVPHASAEESLGANEGT
jgi:hypothetical protein